MNRESLDFLGEERRAPANTRSYQDIEKIPEEQRRDLQR
jgi:hypothetical protein